MKTGNNILDDFLKELTELGDPRRGQGQRHKIEFVLMITIFATMSGYIGYRAIGDFIKKHKKELVALFNLEKDRVPSFSTVRRVLLSIDFTAFTQIYKNWLKRLNDSSKKDETGEWYSIDGKAIRGANKMNREDNKQLVSIFSSFEKIVVDVDRIKIKSNEIPCVQKMIENSDLKGVIFTIDALHCQKKQ
jgi:hypothetical protein